MDRRHVASWCLVLAVAAAGCTVNPVTGKSYLGRAEEVLPGVPDVAYMHGYAFEKLKRRDDAIAAYKETINRDPQGELGAAAYKRLQAMGVAR